MTCPDCATPNCAALRDELLARDFSQPALYWQHHRLAIDAYCVQHDAYVKSAKSLAAHLCGLLIAFEHNSDESLLKSLQQWLSTNPAIQKPALPKHRGALTIAHVHNIDDPAAYGKAVREWAQSAWDAYCEIHPTAREWLSKSRFLKRH